MPETIDWRPGSARRRFLLIVGLIAIIIFGGRTALSYYVDALWFGSLGYGDVFRKMLSLQWMVFAVFFGSKVLILFGWFLALRRTYQSELLSGSLIFIGGRPLRLPVERVL